jgi:hypothetical protein
MTTYRCNLSGLCLCVQFVYKWTRPRVREGEWSVKSCLDHDILDLSTELRIIPVKTPYKGQEQ